MSAAVYEELVAAGAPKLPEGFFFRIREEDGIYAHGMFEVQLRQRGRWWSHQYGRRTVRFFLEEWRQQTSEENSQPLSEVTDAALFAQACARVWAYYKADVAQHEAATRARRFLGDHP